MLRLEKLIKALLAFAAVSGMGLGLDFGLFFLFIHWGATPVVANLISASVAVTFVYFVSAGKVFSYEGRFLLPLFLAYVAYQLVAVFLASLAIGYLARSLGSPGAAKIAVLPVTFAMNFVCMWLLTGRRVTREHAAEHAIHGG